jgi:hypothetical protein
VLDRLARLATWLAAGSAAFVALTAIAIATPAGRERLGLTSAAYVAGSRIDVPREAYDSDNYTVLLFARSTCPASRRATPSLRALVAAATGAGVRVRMISKTPEAEPETQFAHALGLHDADVFGTSLETLRLAQVPTVVIVDRHGRIQSSREGLEAIDRAGWSEELGGLAR